MNKKHMQSRSADCTSKIKLLVVNN
uniref:Uncharacterized protein n=1 Tax=Rhizophora mucronata TaxID=61149 RepID=A0A2P2NAI6_RHIMU